MEFVYHPFGIRETLRFEIKIAVIALPVVVYHQYTCRETVVDDGMRIFENILLVLIVHQFNPGIVLRHGEEKCVGQLTVSWEILRLRGHIGLT